MFAYYSNGGGPWKMEGGYGKILLESSMLRIPPPV
jgi:hypothetical protein